MLARGGVEAALQLVIGAVINTYESVVSWLESSTDDLANIMFEERPLEQAGAAARVQAARRPCPRYAGSPIRCAR